MIALIMPVVTWIGGMLVKNTLLNVVSPALAVGKWLVEIVVDLSKSREGRIVLLAIVCFLALAYGRWHYIQQGRAEMLAHPSDTLIEHIKSTLPACKSAADVKPETFDPFHDLFSGR